MNPELLFGKIAVDAGLVRREHVQECLDEQRRLRQEGKTEKLGEILVRKGYLTDKGRRFILANHEYVETRAVDRRLGVLAVQNGFCTTGHVQTCLDLQKKEYLATKRLPRIGDILRREGRLTEDQLEAIVSLQRRLEASARSPAPPPIPIPASSTAPTVLRPAIRPAPRVPQGPLAAGAQTAGREAAGCALCAREMEEDDELILCGGCGAAHHKLCYELRAACGVCRRRSEEATAPVPTPLPPPPARTRRSSSALRAAVPVQAIEAGTYGSANAETGDGPMVRDLSMEGHLAAIGLWYRTAGLLGLFVIVLSLLAVALSEPMQLRAKTYAVTVFAMCIVVLVGLLGSSLVFVLGHHLARRSNTARLTAGLLTVLSLLGNGLGLAGAALSVARPEVQSNPLLASSVGSVLVAGVLSLLWGLALLWAFFNSRASWVCSEAYNRAVMRGPKEAPYTWRSPFFWLPLIPTMLFVGGILLSLVRGQ